MTNPMISEVLAWEALDSRGRPTVACRVLTEDGGCGRAVVPSGASTGTHEAVELRDGEPRYAGQGVRSAVKNVNVHLGPAVVGLDAGDQSVVDETLETVDGTPELSRLGANAVLAISLAVLNASASSSRRPLWATGGEPAELPMPMVNIFSGGAHAGGAIDIQDVLVVPLCATTTSEAIEIAAAVRAGTADYMRTRGMQTALVADEGGLAAPLRTNVEALELVTEGIRRAGLEPGIDAALAIDLAANQLAAPEGLLLRSENRTVSYSEWMDEILTWVDEYPVCSLEDVLPDGAWDEWAVASFALNDRVQLVGDDLFVTNSALLTRGIEAGIANSVLVKLNQAGTVSRARHTLELAQSAGYSTVISARSGDTEDYWLSDLAVLWNAGQIKVGSSMRSERTSKWNRLLEIEASSSAPLARFPSVSAR